MICIARNYYDDGLTGALDQTECIWEQSKYKTKHVQNIRWMKTERDRRRENYMMYKIINELTTPKLT